MQHPLNPDAELVIWGPAQSYPLVRVETCARALFSVYQTLYPGYGWSDVLVLTGSDRFAWICEKEAIEKRGEKLFVDMMLPREKREAVRSVWRSSLLDLQSIQKEIETTQLQDISNDELVRLWKEFHLCTDAFWAHATLPELSNYGSVEYMRKALVEFVPGSEMASVLEVLTAPTELSFYQEEEIDLAETEDVDAHQGKYFWLKNSYANVEELPVSFFEERKRTLPQNVRGETERHIDDAKRMKLDVQAKYGLPQSIMDIAEAIADGIVWQDTRKKDIWIYLHYEDLLLDEIVRRYSVQKNDLWHLTVDEVEQFMRGELEITDHAWRKNGLAYVATADGKIRIENSDTAHSYWKKYVDTATEADVTEFKGIVASRGSGVVRGRVCVVRDAYKSDHFRDGDVLVTTMTTPEFVFLMKKASAIVTDTGGLTSHAAIVSRELRVPCIVGTKVATQVFKDGDMVEVDATNGIVRKL